MADDSHPPGLAEEGDEPFRSNVEDGGQETERVVFHVTGFGRFAGVDDNPTTHLIRALPAYLEQHPDPGLAGAEFSSWTVLETSAVGSRESFARIVEDDLEAAARHKPARRRVVFVHFGVSSVAPQILLERYAVNTANFRVPDERGFSPMHEPVVDVRPLEERLTTKVQIDETAAALRAEGHSVGTSDDAGRFVCNWIYYVSLHYAAEHPEHCATSLFVHVPPFERLPMQSQLGAARALFRALARAQH